VALQRSHDLPDTSPDSGHTRLAIRRHTSVYCAFITLWFTILAMVGIAVAIGAVLNARNVFLCLSLSLTLSVSLSLSLYLSLFLSLLSLDVAVFVNASNACVSECLCFYFLGVGAYACACTQAPVAEIDKTFERDRAFSVYRRNY